MAEKIKGWTGIFIGCFILASGFVYFINPYNIVPGGVYGASIIMHTLFPSIQVGTFGYIFEIPLLLLSCILLGSKLGVRTIVAALTTPLIMNFLSYVSYPTQEALESLDPTQLCEGVINMTDHLLLGVIIGSVLIGVGCGIIVRCEATSGGTDIVAYIIQKYMHIRFSTSIMIVDGLVVMCGFVVFGLGLGGEQTDLSWHLSFYSLIAIFVISRVLAYVINGAKDDKLLFVISNANMSSLHTFILNELDRTATIIRSSGLYSKADKEMLFLVVSYKEVAKVKAKIREADPTAFVVVTDAYDTFGEGWKQLPTANEVQPE